MDERYKIIEYVALYTKMLQNITNLNGPDSIDMLLAFDEALKQNLGWNHVMVDKMTGKVSEL